MKMSKKLEAEKLPENYINLSYDVEPVLGPSAPPVSQEDENCTATFKPMAGSSILKQAEAEKREESLKPPPVPSAPSLPPDTEINYNPPVMEFQDVYEACMKYARDRFGYNSKFVRQMKLTELKNGCAYHYVLETFGEKRSFSDRTVPYKGEPIDGPEKGTITDPWDIPIPMPDLFKDSQMTMDIPHTDIVSTCSECNGKAELTCDDCFGDTWALCKRCYGTGTDVDDNRCSFCFGKGRTNCQKCSGTGERICRSCAGYRKVKKYRILIVIWTSHPQEFITEIPKFPKENLRKAEGDILFQEEDVKVLPVMNAPDVSVNIASTRMVEGHKRAFPVEVIRKQRHYLRAIPFTKVQYKWKEATGEFYIYGKDRVVYFEDYPDKSSCCIS